MLLRTGAKNSAANSAKNRGKFRLRTGGKTGEEHLEHDLKIYDLFFLRTGVPKRCLERCPQRTKSDRCVLVLRLARCTMFAVQDLPEV